MNRCTVCGREFQDGIIINEMKFCSTECQEEF